MRSQEDSAKSQIFCGLVRQKRGKKMDKTKEKAADQGGALNALDLNRKFDDSVTVMDTFTVNASCATGVTRIDPARKITAKYKAEGLTLREMLRFFAAPEATRKVQVTMRGSGDGKFAEGAPKDNDEVSYTMSHLIGRGKKVVELPPTAAHFLEAFGSLEEAVKALEALEAQKKAAEEAAKVK